MNNQNLKIIGTSHVSKESQVAIKEAFAKFHPDIIAIELDKQRLTGLLSNQKSKLGVSAIGKLGITGYLFAVIGRALQGKIGDLVGTNPGEEMLLGARLARNNNLPLALIDQDVQTTLRNLSKRISAKEKWRIAFDIIFSPFRKQERIKIDISKVPPGELIERLMGQMKERYPGFYRVLLEDRNKVMAKKLFIILRNNPEKKVIAIVGAGHVQGIKQQLKTLEESNIAIKPSS